MSKYVFKLPEYTNHIDGLLHELYYTNTTLNIDNTLLLDAYQKSTFIHVYYRLFILRMLKTHHLIEKYDWFIINRSDLKHTRNIDVSLLNSVR